MIRVATLMVIVLIISASHTLFAQNPGYQAILANDSVINSTTYEFDIYLKGTDTTRFELAGFQAGLTFNDNISTGATWTCTYVTGTSELLTAQIPAAGNVASLSGTTRIFKLAAKAPPGAGAGTLISKTGRGTRIGRFRLVTSLSWTRAQANFAWSFNAASPFYPSKVSAYVGGLNTDITVQASHVSQMLNNPLPVELTSFGSTVQGRTVTLNWKTATELNSDRFEIERAKSSDKVWSSVATVKAAGTSTTVKDYTYTDKKLNTGKYIYRLKMVDQDGTFKYSNEVEGDVSAPKEFALEQNYPNPFNPSTRIDFQVPFNARIRIELYSINGEKVSTLFDGDLAAGYQSVDVNATRLGLSSGIYFYRMVAAGKNAENFNAVKKMVMLK